MSDGYDRALARLREMGGTVSVGPSPLFGDRVVTVKLRDLWYTQLLDAEPVVGEREFLGWVVEAVLRLFGSGE